MITTRTHLMAREAYRRVAARVGLPDKEKEQYRSLAQALPGMILQNGLAQATGFLIAKCQTEHKALLGDLNAVLQAADVVSAGNDVGQLHEEIIGSDDPQRWMQLTRHALEASGWIKRYAQGLLKDRGDRHTEDQTHAAGGSA